jgi:hypothetical protein
MDTITDQNVEIVPFAARAFWSSPQDYEIWWEEPRDIFRVAIHFPAGAAPDPADLSLAYWRASWPRLRIPKGAVVGAGESGWLANDDWTNGQWQTADCLLQPGDGSQGASVCTFTFRPLNEREFPQEQEFPVVFRRSLKLRLHFAGAPARPEPLHPFERVCAYTDSEWRTAQVAIEWKSPDGAALQRDGWLEAYNGAILALEPLSSAADSDQLRLEAPQATSPQRWQARLSGAASAGVLATVRYAHNPDRNSFDKTILTLSSAFLGGDLPGLSFLMDDVLAGEPVYVRDLGVLVSRVEPGTRPLEINAFEQAWQQRHPLTLYQQIHARPEQTWEDSWANMPRKKTRMYFTLGCEGGRQKFGVEPNGDLFLTDNGLRWSPGKDTPRLGWDEGQGRELRICLGLPAVEPGERALLDGYLPIIRTAWLDGGILYEQEAYATWLWGMPASGQPPGDDPVIAMLQLRFTNLTAEPKSASLSIQTLFDRQPKEQLALRGEWVCSSQGHWRLHFRANGAGRLSQRPPGLLYQLDLPPRAVHTVDLRLPHLDLDGQERERLEAISYPAEKEAVAAFWRRRIAQGAPIETPNETINNFYRTHLMHLLVINDREPGAERNAARCGGFHYGNFSDEGCMAIENLERRGLHQEAERCLEMYVHYQGSVPLPGNFSSAEGVFYGANGYEMGGYNRNHGWVLWCLAAHYRYTRDRAWLQRIAPALVKGCDWITRERQATLQPGTIQYGFLPSGSLEDVTDYWTWLATNAYAGWGFRAAAEVLAEIDHPQADRLLKEAQAFNRDLRAGFMASCARSPVVRLRDGSWVPHFPARQERRGRDFGWLREVLEGACHLIFCGIIAPDEPAAAWIIQDFEDNLFLSEGYGYGYENSPDFDRLWFHLGGFSMQSNLLLFPPLYLWRDEPKHYLRAYFNAFTSAFFPDTVTMCEHALPDLENWRGDHFKSSDEANSNNWLRSIFLSEHGQELWIGAAMPRAWLEHGQKARIERAPTHFGPASAAFVSQAATGLISVHLDLPTRNPPDRIRLRLRHPQGRPLSAVWVNGLPHQDFDPAREWIFLQPQPAQVEVHAYYA